MWVLVVHWFNVVVISWYVLVLSHLILLYLVDHAQHP